MKKFKNEKEALHFLIGESWELSNKPHRFFSSLIKVVEKFYDSDNEKYYLDKNGKKEILEILNLIKNKGYTLNK